MADRKPVRRRKKKKGSNNNKIIRNIIIGAEAVVLVAVIVILIYAFKATDKETGVKKYDLDPDEITINKDENDEEVKEIRNDYTTLAFFGVDARNGTLQKGTRTDTIIICSIVTYCSTRLFKSNENRFVSTSIIFMIISIFNH